MIKKTEIIRVDFSTRKIERKVDTVAEEKPLSIFLNEEHYATILSSPNQLKELAVGHLLSEGILESLNEIREMKLDGDRFHIRLSDDIDIEKRLRNKQPYSRLITTSCGASGQWLSTKIVERLYLPKGQANTTLDGKVVSESVRRLNAIAEIFKKTGGVHVASLNSFNGKLIALAEDVGRHNAVDKIIGSALMKGLALDECFIGLSGRLSGDIVLKAARVGIPVVASISAALNSGVEVAQLVGMTLIAFVRGARMSILTHPERIKINLD